MRGRERKNFLETKKVGERYREGRMAIFDVETKM